MRYLRAKAIRKALRQFQFLCGIKPPYKVLLDINFIAMCHQAKVELKERVAKFLQVKLYQCEFFIPEKSIQELKLIGDSMKPVLESIKMFSVIESKASEDSVDMTKEILAIIGECNAGKYIVATQEVELRKQLRQIPGVPLIYLNRSVLVFEDISRATVAIVRQKEQSKLAKLDEAEKQTLEVVDEERSRLEDVSNCQRIKRKPKQPNPLSCKKPQKKKIRSKTKKIR
uniref:rRNAprocessing protein putative n=1 Tax=Albugo laibachii Nc14 TaxID=890382 RepID=F0WJZ3_9STRA|nr:rRNAprocessing protein putative [Albugo laibachii Nc14]|eukprot:CCA21595.1 rRNAprocessing protein putative [Albugo laibachii Nc14]